MSTFHAIAKGISITVVVENQEQQDKCMLHYIDCSYFIIVCLQGEMQKVSLTVIVNSLLK